MMDLANLMVLCGGSLLIFVAAMPDTADPISFFAFRRSMRGLYPVVIVDKPDPDMLNIIDALDKHK